MLLVTESGMYFTVVEDREDPEYLYARSQDRESVEHAIKTLKALGCKPTKAAPLKLIDEPDWDYQYRVRVDRAQWAAYLERVTDEVHADRLKPAVARARGKQHPVARMVEEVFYFMSKNRPSGTTPAWLRGYDGR